MKFATVMLITEAFLAICHGAEAYRRWVLLKQGKTLRLTEVPIKPTLKASDPTKRVVMG